LRQLCCSPSFFLRCKLAPAALHEDEIVGVGVVREDIGDADSVRRVCG
jgi:hypothetical protein